MMDVIIVLASCELYVTQLVKGPWLEAGVTGTVPVG
jgi:hypothetical protein